MIRAIIIAATAATLITMYLDRPKPVRTVEVKYCFQPIWNIWGDKIGGKWVKCSELDRYEWA